MIPHPPSLLPNKLHTDPSLRTEDSLSSRVRTAFVCACIQPCVRVSNRVGADDGARCFQLPPTLDQRWQQSQFSSLGSCTRHIPAGTLFASGRRRRRWGCVCAAQYTQWRGAVCARAQHARWRGCVCDRTVWHVARGCGLCVSRV